MQCSEMPEGIGVSGRAKMIFLLWKCFFSFRSPVGVAGQPSLSVSLNPMAHDFMPFTLSQKWSLTEIRHLGSWLCRFFPFQGNFTEIAVPEVMWYDLKYQAESFPCNRSEIQVCICNVCKQLLENSPGGCLKTVRAENRWLLVQEVSWTFVVSAPRFGGCPTHHQGKDRETKLRHGEGHSEIPTRGTMLLLVLCRPLGTDGLTSWGAHNDACPAAWADTATVHCGIKLKCFRWKDTQCPFPKWWGTQSSPESDLLPGAGHQLSQGLPAQSLSRQIAARGFKLFA